ncbi:9076_t:CDS:2 [Ambispora gerdemannii]|uniref:9076_t:CDS:1 n=1 Tax=Ambispora gerdemannii TaxID=144530 RepID=A0A9N8YVQ0_9GLOM|nr:9076_t:CDS:2 [Ambispora gerdemannii]
MNDYQKINLPYGLNDLEPVISFKTMIKLDEALRGTEIEQQSLEKLMENLEQLPEEIRNDVRFFGGGLINHNFFFLHLTPFKSDHKEYEREESISLALLNLIQGKFTNLKRLKKELVKSALRDGPWSLHCRPLIAIDV